MCNFVQNDDENFRELVSKSQIGRKHRSWDKTEREKISDNMKNVWADPIQRAYRLEILRSSEVRSKISKAVSENFFKKHISFVDDIRCESKAEEKFVQMCIQNGNKVVRFHHDGEKSIKLSDSTWKVPDFLMDNVIVEVKDFHPWFLRELFSGLEKYRKIVKWCRKNDYIFVFWFEKYGYQTYEDLLKIRTPEDLDIFLSSEISKRV